MEFQIDFSSYLAQFFELNLHIWYLGSYLNMFLEKIKVFVKKYFFVMRGRFSIKNSVIYCSRILASSVPFSPKIDLLGDKIALSRRLFGVGRASASRKSGRVMWANFPQLFSVLRAFQVSEKVPSLFYSLIETKGIIYAPTWWNLLISMFFLNTISGTIFRYPFSGSTTLRWS